MKTRITATLALCIIAVLCLSPSSHSAPKVPPAKGLNLKLTSLVFGLQCDSDVVIEPLSFGIPGPALPTTVRYGIIPTGVATGCGPRTFGTAENDFFFESEQTVVFNLPQGTLETELTVKFVLSDFSSEELPVFSVLVTGKVLNGSQALARFKAAPILGSGIAVADQDVLNGFDLDVRLSVQGR
jgi:hypothetical protein